MRYVLTGLFHGIIFSVGMVFAQEPLDVRCQALASQFSENPDNLAMQELERLRFCVNQALEHREQSLKGELLKGTIIESPPSSGSSTEIKAPEAPKSLGIMP
jgi:hypothetical protein